MITDQVIDLQPSDSHSAEDIKASHSSVGNRLNYTAVTITVYAPLRIAATLFEWRRNQFIAG